MSTYSDCHDEALSQAQWVSKTCGGRQYLFKYAPHPDGAGHLFISTDLETMTFEELTSSGMASRLALVRGSDALTLGYREQRAREDEALAALDGVFNGGWARATIERDVDDFFDAVFVLKSGDFKWIFQMTELRGRQPLSIISKQLLSPWAALLAQDRSVSLGGSSPPPAAAVSAIISDPGVARALRRVTGAGPPRPATSAPATPPRARSPSPQRARSPVRTPPRAASPQATPLPPPPSAARAGAAPLVRAGSPTPVARRKAYDLAAGIFPSSDAAPSSDADEEVYDDETSMLPPAQRPPSQSRSPMPSSPAAPSPTQLATPRPSARPAPPLLLRSSPPAPPTFLPTSEADFRLPSEADFRLPSDADYTAPPSSTADPLIPTLPNKKKKKKDPKKIEEEEEAAANKRREEMKKRMAAGGGGRLGRRRA